MSFENQHIPEKYPECVFSLEVCVSLSDDMTLTLSSELREFLRCHPLEEIALKGVLFAQAAVAKYYRLGS